MNESINNPDRGLNPDHIFEEDDLTLENGDSLLGLPTANPNSVTDGRAPTVNNLDSTPARHNPPQSIEDTLAAKKQIIKDDERARQLQPKANEADLKPGTAHSEEIDKLEKKFGLK